MNGADIQKVEETSFDHESVEMESKAKAVAEVLSRHYPNYPWAIGWAPGMTLVVKNLVGDARYGYTIDAANSFSSSDLAHLAMVAGGELLERLGLKRGAWDGDMPNQQYEGATKQ